jgi:hypothetical protein
MRNAISGCVAIAIMLQGCVGTANVLGTAEQQSLQSFQLFTPDTSPRFTLDLACVSHDMSCLTVENTFSDWANNRQIGMRMVEPEDLMLNRNRRSKASQPATPYRLAVRFAPLVVASYNMIYSKGNTLSGGYTPPSVSYTATLFIFDATTGKLLRQIPFHDRRTGEFKAEANEYIRNEVNNFIASLDPTYRRS